MFEPRNTALDVAALLAKDLTNGSILLDGTPQTSQKEEDELEEQRRRKLALHTRSPRATDEIKTKT